MDILWEYRILLGDRLVVRMSAHIKVDPLWCEDKKITLPFIAAMCGKICGALVSHMG